MKAKKLVSIVLAVFLLAAITVPAFAALDDHDYVAYQIFSGKQAEGNAKLAKIEWGSAIDGATFLPLVTKLSAFADCKTADDVARVLSEVDNDSALAMEFARLCYKNVKGDGAAVSGGSALDAGLYLVVDATEPDPKDVNTAVNLALLQLTNKGEFEIREKVSVPTVKKEVYEESVDAWQKAADYDIDDSVPFRLTATVGKISGFKSYHITFHDQMCDGLTFDSESAKSLTVGLYRGGEKVMDILGGSQSDRYQVSYTAHTFDLKVLDLVTLGAQEGDQVIVTYNATLNTEAEIGFTGNPNNVYLEYSNNPNVDSGNETGKTPEDKVIVYTWANHVDKVSDDGEEELKPLGGASFKLYRKDAEDKLVLLGEKEVVEVKKDDKIVSYSVDFTGLDSATYVLEESVVPDGYNGIEPIEFTITASFDDTEVDVFEVDNEFEALDGTVFAQVVNKCGIVLPETGGYGTYAFYVLGGLLLAGGLVLIITKKRLGAEA